MKVLILTSRIAPSLGGVETFVDKLASQLLKRGWIVTIVTNVYRNSIPGVKSFKSFLIWYKNTFGLRIRAFLGIGDFSRGYKVIETYFIFFGISKLRSLLTLFLFPFTLLHFLYLLFVTRPDVINLHFVDNNAVYVLLTKLFQPKIKVVVSVHGSDVSFFPKYSRIQKFLLTKLVKTADSVVAVSESLKKELLLLVPHVEKKTSVIHNAIDSAWYKMERYTPQIQGDYIFAYGRLVYVKGFDILINAFSEFQKRIGKVCKLVIAGGGVEIDALQKQAAGLWVDFLGPCQREDLRNLIYYSKFVVTPSRNETFGIVNIECMSLGKAVIASRVGGVPEYIENGVNSLLFESENYVDLFDKMAVLFKSDSLRRKLGKKARDDVLKKFTFKNVATSYEKIYSN